MNKTRLTKIGRGGRGRGLTPLGRGGRGLKPLGRGRRGSFSSSASLPVCPVLLAVLMAYALRGTLLYTFFIKEGIKKLRTLIDFTSLIILILM